jgi:superfamily II RNA helicase
MVAFSTFSYDLARTAKRAQKTQTAKYGSKEAKAHLTPKQEATIWTVFVSQLRKEDKLPAIAFTLSRQRCDQNARNLTSVDLTTESEKSFVHRFFDKSIRNLKEPDRALPQVKHTFMYFTVTELYQLHRVNILQYLILLFFGIVFAAFFIIIIIIIIIIFFLFLFFYSYFHPST